MLKKPSEKKFLKPFVLKNNQISGELKDLIVKHDILSVSGTLGIKEGYSPIEYEEVKIKAGGKVSVIRIFNKGMAMMASESPEIKRVFEFMNKLYILSQRK